MSDDWETDPDFVNDVSEREQRWGSKTVAGSGRQPSIDMEALRREVIEADQNAKLKAASNLSYGYGGKFGVETDRMDKSAVGHDHIEPVEKHSSQIDYRTGFGGRFGVQSDRQDKCAVGWDHVENVEKHPSQKDYAIGFGGKYGVQEDRQDKSAVDWSYRSESTPHASQANVPKVSYANGEHQAKTLDAVNPSSDGENETKLHPSQMKADVPNLSGSVAALRDRFNAKPQAGTNRAVRSVAQQRVCADQFRWNEGNKTSTRAQTDRNSPVLVSEAPSQLEENPKQVSPVFPPPTAISEPVNEPVRMCTAVALFDYTAVEDDELTFSTGELITEIEKIDPGWWKGVCRGKIGLLPSNYVQEQ
ncbi:unnamed protein product [Dicrocoelium dendriticum]|nr:unnamed protein product [Dicrocoelium dendriticum]